MFYVVLGNLFASVQLNYASCNLKVRFVGYSTNVVIKYDCGRVQIVVLFTLDPPQSYIE